VREQHHRESIQGWTQYVLDSDDQGKVRLLLATPRNFRIQVEKPGFATRYVSTPQLIAQNPIPFKLVSSTPIDELEGDLELGLDVPVTGCVHDAGGRPLSGVTVQGCLPLDPNYNMPIERLCATTDKNGDFTLRGLAAGRRYALTVDMAGFGPVVQFVTPPARGAVDFTLEVPGKLTGTIVDPRGEGHDSFIVQSRDDDGEWHFVSTRFEGMTATGLRPGTYRIVACAGMAEAATPPLTVEAGKETKATLKLPAPRRVDGMVVDGSRSPVARARTGFRVTLPFSKRTFGTGGSTDENGKFYFIDVPDDDVVFTIAKPGFKRATVKVPAGCTDVGEIVLVPGELEPDPEGDE